MRMSRYEAPRKLGKLERDVRVAQGAAESNSSLLSALELQTPQVLHISIYAQLKGRMEKPESGIQNPESGVGVGVGNGNGNGTRT